MSLQKKAEAASKEIYIGGPPERFECYGRLQLITLIRVGLNPASKLLDVGCGALRGGYWFIQLLNPGCYYGIEPNRTMLDGALRKILEPDMISQKKPRFDHNSEFEFSVFGETFDYVVARSVWSHASKKQIKKMLDSFIQISHKDSIFLVSFFPAGFRWRVRKLLNPINWLNFKKNFYRSDYLGDEWVGKSDLSNCPGIVAHRFDWIDAECEKRGLIVERHKQDNFTEQKWLRIEHKK